MSSASMESLGRPFREEYFSKRDLHFEQLKLLDISSLFLESLF